MRLLLCPVKVASLSVVVVSMTYSASRVIKRKHIIFTSCVCKRLQVVSRCPRPLYVVVSVGFPIKRRILLERKVHIASFSIEPNSVILVTTLGVLKSLLYLFAYIYSVYWSKASLRDLYDGSPALVYEVYRPVNVYDGRSICRHPVISSKRHLSPQNRIGERNRSASSRSGYNVSAYRNLRNL